MATLSTDCHQRQQPICMVQTPINPVMNPRADMVQLGYLSYPHFITPIAVPSHVYKCGYNDQGRIIGSNVTVPYPTKTSHVKGLPSSMKEEMAGCATSYENKNLGCEPEEVSPEIDEYFTAENDEGYRKWAERKSEAERKKKENRQNSQLSNTTPFENLESRKKLCSSLQNDQPVSDFDNWHSHYMPTNLITSNQTYGSYIDLKENYPPPKIQIRNKRTVPTRVINSTSALPKEQRSHALDVHNLVMHHVASQKVPYNNVIPRNIMTIPAKGDVMGVREKGYTFPIYTKTGLELVRPCASGASMFASMGRQKFYHRRRSVNDRYADSFSTRAHFRNQPTVCLPYSMMQPHGCPQTKTAVQSPITYACMQSNAPMLG